MTNHSALDLTQRPPRSPRTRLGGFVLLPRMLDKGRAEIAGKNGEYYYNCPLDQHFVNFVKVDPAAMREQLAAGKGDGEILNWIHETASQKRTPWEIEQWSDYMLRRGPDQRRGDARLFWRNAGQNQPDTRRHHDLGRPARPGRLRELRRKSLKSRGFLPGTGPVNGGVLPGEPHGLAAGPNPAHSGGNLMTPEKLQSARDRLDELDQRVVHALAERQRLVEEVAALKSDPSLPLQDATREHDLLARVAKLAEAEKLDGYFVQSLYRRILEHSVRFQAARQGETKSDSALVVAFRALKAPTVTRPRAPISALRRAKCVITATARLARPWMRSFAATPSSPFSRSKIPSLVPSPRPTTCSAAPICISSGRKFIASSTASSRSSRCR